MNSKKKSKTASSIYKGIYFRKRSMKWIAHICFKTEIEGAKAYDTKARELFGEFAKCNFEEDDD